MEEEMAVRRDDADAIQYAALKLERHQITQEIARLSARNFDRDIGRLTKKVESIEARMKELREQSMLVLR